MPTSKTDDDLVERLRSAHLSSGAGTLMHKAADEIEWLRATLQRIVAEADSDNGWVEDIARRALEPKP